MVAPHEIGNTTKSFVRVPGTGVIKTATPSMCDLGKLSTCASRILVPRSPPNNIICHNSTPTTLKTVPVTTKPSPSSLKIVPVTIQVAIPTQIVTELELVQLKKEIQQLKLENNDLKRQLSLFKQLIKNPNRLGSVLSRLKERENPNRRQILKAKRLKFD